MDITPEIQLRKQSNENATSQRKDKATNRQVGCVHVEQVADDKAAAEDVQAAKGYQKSEEAEEDPEVCFIDTYTEPRDEFQRKIEICPDKKSVSEEVCRSTA